MNNDTQTSAPVTQESATTTTPTPAPAAIIATKSKNKSKPRRTRTRRRAAASDQESGDEAGGGARSDSSLSSRSDAPHSESDNEPAAKVTPAGPKTKGSKSSKASKAPVFADVSSITPAGWSGKNGEGVTPVSFEDFNSGKEAPSAPSRGTGLSIRGRGKGKVEPATKREYTPEETAKYEAQKAKRKEKVKAKKAALKEEKQKDSVVPKAVVNGDSTASKPAEPPTAAKDPAPAPASSAGQPVVKPPKAKGKKRNESITASAQATPPTVEQVTASTSAVTLDAPAVTESAPSPSSGPKASTPTAGTPSATATPQAETSSSAQPRQPPRQPRGNARDAHAQRVAEDPKITPRTGQFWTHDQRLHENGNTGEGYNNAGLRQMGPFWRGRAMPRGAFRGNMRGRGRGGFFPNGRGGFVNGGPPRTPVELSQEENNEPGSSKLAMDREYELAEARDKARAAPTAPVTEAAEPAPVEDIPGEAAATPVAEPPVAPSSERKWGHEGYEAMSAPAPGQLRGAYRGRIRGAGTRGRGVFFPRGGHLPFAPPHRQMRPAQLVAAARAQPQAHAQAPSTSTAATTTTASPVAEAENKLVVNDHEKMSTQPTADSLLDPADESFKIKFPGSAASTVPASASTSSPTVSSTPVPAPAGAPATSSKAEPSAAVVADAQLVNETSTSAPSASASSPAPQTSEPQFPSLQTGSPAPSAAVQAQMYTGGSNHSIYPMGSENGSVGSGHFVQHPSQFYAQEFVPNGVPIQQRPGFYPQLSQRGYPTPSPQFYPPQSPYSPGPYEQHPHQHAQRGSFSGAPMTSPQGVFFPQGQGNGYANGRSSPLNPYMNMNHSGGAANGGGGGFFAPVRGSNKVAIRAPNQNGNESNEAASGPGANGATSTTNGDPSATGGTYHAQHYNPYVQPFVPGQRQETTYYPLANGQYAWQGYNGEQAYYDGGVNYGY